MRKTPNTRPAVTGRRTPLLATIAAGLLLAAGIAYWLLDRRAADRDHPSAEEATPADLHLGHNGADAAPAASGSPATPAGDFAPTIPNGAAAPGPSPAGMVWIPGGEFSMGARDPRGVAHGGTHDMPDARPIHRVAVDGFWMDVSEVTNEQFARFVKETGYVTVAERIPRAEDFPGAPPENLLAGSVVFAPTDEPVPLDDLYRWWTYVPGANWRHPMGPDSDIVGRESYPVVQVAYEDAQAYAAWAGGRLPTEAEWELAARGGLAGNLYPWGDELEPGGRQMANIYEGTFPIRGTDTGRDGYKGIAPVGQYPANAYGLHDMAGNVWEWVSDWYRADYYTTLAAQDGPAVNPQGPSSSFDPDDPKAEKRVHRGGSFLCTEQYCVRYMIGTRGKGEVTTGSNHLGLRLVRNAAAGAAGG
jgi:sulfatase modifying factor 1